MSKLTLEQELATKEQEVAAIRKKIAEEAQRNKPKSIMDTIKTMDDVYASKYLTEDDKRFFKFKDMLTKDELAYFNAKCIAKVLNEGHVFKMDGSENRYYPYFYLSSGFVFDIALCDVSIADAASASALCFLSRELALYAGKQFEEVYRDLIIG
jgi:hypothetical protein